MVTRPWREIAKELSEEKGSERLLELAVELGQALDEQMPSKGKWRPKDEGPRRSPNA
jgi:hypothetical protein